MGLREARATSPSVNTVSYTHLILEDTDILLLDEPTNHLDMRATEWLEDYILHFLSLIHI